MSRCFISHATGDRVFVENELLGLLKALGVESWYAEENIETGDQWERSILAGLESSDWFIVVMSSRSASSEWVRDEVNWAITNMPGRIVPVLIGDCKATDFHIRLPRFQYADYRTDPNKGRLKLLTIIVDAEYRPIRRAAAINGLWKGTAYQSKGLNGNPMDYPIEMHLTVKRKTIDGSLTICPPDRDETRLHKFNVTGGFVYERFLQINYISEAPEVIQFGSALTEIDATGTKMIGEFIGYGARSEAIVSGTVELEKPA